MEDVHETRDGIEKLLTADGYRVAPARDELDTIIPVMVFYVEDTAEGQEVAFGGNIYLKCTLITSIS
jgi:hypothetical protein